MGDTESISRAGEYLVAHLLEERGIRVSRVDLSSHDLWCRTPSGRLVSVQVKSTLGPFGLQTGKPRYAFYNAGSEVASVDVFAFAALDRRLALFERTMRTRRNLLADDMTVEAMEASIARFFG